MLFILVFANIINMKTKMLIDTNPYLKDPKKRALLIARSVITSCAVEGIDVASINHIKIEIPKRRDKKIYHLLDQP